MTLWEKAPIPLPALTPLPAFSRVSSVRMPKRAIDDPLLSIPASQKGPDAGKMYRER